MHPHRWLVITFAAVCRLAAAVSNHAVAAAPASTPTISHIMRDQVQWPIGVSAFEVLEGAQVGGPQQSLHLTHTEQRLTPRAAQQVEPGKLPRATVAGQAATNRDVLLKFLPTPGPLPTTTPHYALDLDAQRSAAIASNQARLQTSIPSTSNTTITITPSPSDAATTTSTNGTSTRVHWTTASMDEILSVIKSLDYVQSSLVSKISSADMASSVAAEQLQSVSSALGQAEDHLYHRVHYGADTVTDDTGAASLLSSPMALAISLTAAAGFAGLAMFL